MTTDYLFSAFDIGPFSFEVEPDLDPKALVLTCFECGQVLWQVTLEHSSLIGAKSYAARRSLTPFARWVNEAVGYIEV